VQHVHPGKTRADHDDIVALVCCRVAPAGTGLQSRHQFALPWILLVLAGSILPMAPKRKGQNGWSEPHILPHGMRWCAIAAPGASTQDMRKQSRLASIPVMS
jgi:hypothetical protein